MTRRPTDPVGTTRCEGCDVMFFTDDDSFMHDDVEHFPVRDDTGQWWCCEDCKGETEYEHQCEAMQDERDPESEHWLIDGVGFADPGGRSALRAATDANPRTIPCPTCRTPNALTPADQARGYQCDACADAAEGRPVVGREY